MSTLFYVNFIVSFFHETPALCSGYIRIFCCFAAANILENRNHAIVRLAYSASV